MRKMNLFPYYRSPVIIFVKSHTDQSQVFSVFTSKDFVRLIFDSVRFIFLLVAVIVRVCESNQVGNEVLVADSVGIRQVITVYAIPIISHVAVSADGKGQYCISLSSCSIFRISLCLFIPGEPFTV